MSKAERLQRRGHFWPCLLTCFQIKENPRCSLSREREKRSRQYVKRINKQEKSWLSQKCHAHRFWQEYKKSTIWDNSKYLAFPLYSAPESLTESRSNVKSCPIVICFSLPDLTATGGNRLGRSGSIMKILLIYPYFLEARVVTTEDVGAVPSIC